MDRVSFSESIVYFLLTFVVVLAGILAIIAIVAIDAVVLL